MRTTLDIADDVLQAARELVQRQGGTAGQVISDLARRGLNVPTSKSRPSLRGGVPLLPSRGEVVTLEHVRKLQDQEGV
ncbi:MAG: CopG family transcriptional regulator [Verrucomicrobia bacterium]|nr:CopG family transcriptional regulator [Verrucomicrobiota bacterium]